MTTADFFALPRFVRTAIVAYAQRDPKRHELRIAERLDRAYRALCAC